MSHPDKPIEREPFGEQERTEQQPSIPWCPDEGITLSPEATVDFVTALLTPKEPNAKLKEAARLYREFMRDNAID